MVEPSDPAQAGDLDQVERAERAGTARAILLVGTGLLAVGLVLSIALSPRPVTNHAPYALMLVAHLTALALIRRGATRVGLVMFTVVYVAIVLMALAVAGGSLSPAGFVLAPIVLFTGLTLGGRAAILTAGAASAGMVGVLLLGDLGWLPPATSEGPPQVWLVAAISLIVIGAMLNVALRIVRESRLKAVEAQRAREELERRLIQARRLEGVGRLAAGVAHDFNNVLTVIFAEVTRLTARDRSTTTAAAADNIREAANRASALTRQLLSAGRRQLRALERVELGDLVHQLERLLAKLVGDDIRLEVTAEAPAVVSADRTELEQVVLNLVTNGRDAMPDGGALGIRIGVAPAELRARTTLGGDRSAVFLAVTDTGCGITPEVRDRLFEPFFTTKELGKGTGLGLATVEGIVNQVGGSIVIDTEIGAGTTFTVVLPEAEPVAVPVAVIPPGREAPPASAAGADVLVVDDDALVRAAIAAIVTDGGHRVTAVGSAAEAIAACTRAPQPPALLITDVVMADLPGTELAAHLRALHAELRVLFVSGYAEDRLSQRGVLAEGVHFVAKPFDRASLLAKIEDVLASPNLGAIGRAAT